MDFTQFGWRDGVLLLAAAIGVYVALTLLRLQQLGKRKPRRPEFPHDLPTLFAMPGAAAPAPTETAEASSSAADLPFHFSPPAAAVMQAVEHPGAEPPAPSFAEALAGSQLEQEVRQLRAEVTALREELLELQAARRVSPHYADAMALARRGFDARGIADHCGIALGEAELVMALARGGDDLHAENDHVGFESGNGRSARR